MLVHHIDGGVVSSALNQIITITITIITTGLEPARTVMCIDQRCCLSRGAVPAQLAVSAVAW